MYNPPLQNTWVWDGNISTRRTHSSIYIEFMFCCGKQVKRIRRTHASEISSYRESINRGKNEQEQLKIAQRVESLWLEALLKGWKPDVPHNPSTSSHPIYTIRIEQASDIFMEHFPPEIYAATTITGYRVKLNAFIAYLRKHGYGKKTFPEIDPLVFLQYLDELKHPVYYNSSLRTLKAVFRRMAAGSDWKSPLEGLKKRRTRETGKPIFKDGQIKEILAMLDNMPDLIHLKLCMLLMYENAFRPHQEIRNVRKRDLKENNTILSIGTKNRSISTRKLSLDAQHCLAQMNLDHLQDQANIFSRTNQPPSKEYFINKWKTLRRRARTMGNEIPEDLTLYSIRHTMACDLYRKTNSIDAVRRFMDHRSLQTTEGYLRKLGQYTIGNSTEGLEIN